jgi:hypothetical protein
VYLAIIRTDGSVIARSLLHDDIRRWMPGKFNVAGSVRWQAPPGDYSLAIGIADPATSVPSILFANNLPSMKGWTILSKLRVRP